MVGSLAKAPKAKWEAGLIATPANRAAAKKAKRGQNLDADPRRPNVKVINDRMRGMKI